MQNRAVRRESSGLGRCGCWCLAGALALSGCSEGSTPPPAVPAARPLGPRTVAPVDRPALSPARVLEGARPAIVFIESLDRKRQVLAKGSGVIVGKGLVVTPWSLVSRASGLRIRHRDVVRTAVLDAVLEGHDLARLTAEVSDPIGMGRDAYPEAGGEVFAVSSASGADVTLSEGVVSPSEELPDRLSTSMAPAAALTGGALLNPQGELIGILAPGKKGSKNTHAIPVRFVKDLLALPSGALPEATASPLRRLSERDRKWLVGFMSDVARKGQPLGGVNLDRVNALLDRLEPLVGAELAWAKVEMGLGFLTHQRVFWEDAVEARAFRRVVKSARRSGLEKSLLALEVLTPGDVAEADRVMKAIAARETFDTPTARIEANERWLAQMLSETDRRRILIDTQLWEARNR